MSKLANKIRQAEESLARFEADVARYRRTADEKELVAEKWRRYLRRLKGEVASRELRVESGKEGAAA